MYMSLKLSSKQTIGARVEKLCRKSKVGSSIPVPDSLFGFLCLQFIFCFLHAHEPPLLCSSSFRLAEYSLPLSI